MVRHKKKTELYVKCLNINDIKDDRLFWKQSVSYSLERTVSESSEITLIENNEKSTKDAKIAKRFDTSFIST